MKYQAIVLAAGEGKRAGLSYNKILYKIGEESIIFLAAKKFIDDDECEKIYIVYNEKDLMELKTIFNNYNKVSYVCGGKSRQQSVYNALINITSDYVLIHDGARPYFSYNLLNRLKENILSASCVIPVIDSVDSLKIVENNIVVKTINREKIKRVQTPQAFITNILLSAHQKATSNTYADDSAIIEDLTNEKILVVDGETQNIKYTNLEDF